MNPLSTSINVKTMTNEWVKTRLLDRWPGHHQLERPIVILFTDVEQLARDDEAEPPQGELVGARAWGFPCIYTAMLASQIES
jgi:hypothetical protein